MADGEPAEDYTPREPARDAGEVAVWHADNRVSWNQGAVRYTEVVEQTIARLRAGEGNLHPIEVALLGDLASWCGTAIHLQCASGYDTLSLHLAGVPRVVGVDISDVHIDNARATAEAVGIDATFHRCDVLDTPAALDGTADLVYTGRGALNWLADLDAWAAVVARLLAPGGVVSVFEGHPYQWLVEERDGGLVLSGLDYFGAAVTSTGWPDTYIGDLGLDEDALAPMHEQLHPLSAIVMALLRAGLVLEHLGEHPVDYWPAFPEVPDDVLRRLPQTFSLLARKPR
jgi:SAM-dependent methyltransferase